MAMDTDCCADYFEECGAAPPPPCTHEDGDTNNVRLHAFYAWLAQGDERVDQQVNVLDVVTVINSILEFAHSQLTMCEHTASDRNSDGVVDILDVVRVHAVSSTHAICSTVRASGLAVWCFQVLTINEVLDD
eukprot:scaffold1194_cov369-Prasinococcus_capsulatus_cf.AAC.16